MCVYELDTLAYDDMTLTGFSLYAKVSYKLETLIICIYNYTVMSKLTAADMMFSIGEELCLLVQGKKAVRCSDGRAPKSFNVTNQWIFGFGKRQEDNHQGHSKQGMRSRIQRQGRG